jgi:hypothetical protein
MISPEVDCWGKQSYINPFDPPVTSLLDHSMALDMISWFLDFLISFLIYSIAFYPQNIKISFLSTEYVLSIVLYYSIYRFQTVKGTGVSKFMVGPHHLTSSDSSPDQVRGQYYGLATYTAQNRRTVH